ncbi:MAG: hypothetical protein CL678_06120 [Bdellovibrionaceae bacterium]|nr:hypothetical protein [Pseudobdellovibrionaceae bacterium]|tara:strand:- start:1623 stop:2228 length:606 start_codon:yes stop_codon:yes gene_type:complete
MNALLSFIYGFLVKIVDDIYDNDFMLKFKNLFVIILLLLTAYIIFFTKELGISWILILISLGILGIFHSPLIDILPWKLSVVLGFIGFIYYFSNIKDFFNNLKKNDYIFLTTYSIISGTIMLIAEKVITEEYSKRKLIIRILALLLSILTVIYKDTLKQKIDVSDIVFDIFEWTRWVDIGYLTWSIIVMIYFLYFNIKTES